MRRILLFAVCILVTLSLTGCGGSEESSSGEASGGESTSADSPSAEEIVAEIQATAEDADWGADVVTVRAETRFRAPTIVIEVDGDEAASEAVFDGALAVAHEMSPDGPYYLEVGTLSSMDGLSRVGPALPAPVSSPEDIGGWLDAAYGPASGDPVDEAWYEAIVSASTETDPAFGTLVNVKTNIAGSDPDAETQANLIMIAVEESTGGAFEWIRVTFSDGENVTSKHLPNPYVGE